MLPNPSSWARSTTFLMLSPQAGLQHVPSTLASGTAALSSCAAAQALPTSTFVITTLSPQLRRQHDFSSREGHDSSIRKYAMLMLCPHLRKYSASLIVNAVTPTITMV